MLGETFISYKRFRWLWFTLGFLVLSAVVYSVDSPAGGRNGGTVVGYTLGTIATLAVIWLMAYGLRKRAYRSSLGTVEGWLAAHVWIGIGLLFLVPLHAGFSFGLNVHTLAYLAMVITILSGIWGVANYAALSARITSHRGGSKDLAVLEEIFSISERLRELCLGKSEEFLSLFKSYDFVFKSGIREVLKRREIPVVDHITAGAKLRNISEGERDAAVTLLGLLDKRSDLARELLEQLRIKTLLKLWLYVHVPVSIVLCVSLVIHIFSVFYLW